MGQYKFNHYVPATYLNAWADDSKKIWVYSENKFFRHGKPENIMGNSDLYVKTVDDNLTLDDTEKQQIYGSLDEYSILLDGTVLSSIDDYHNNFHKYSDWIITDKEGKKVKKKAILHRIKQIRITRLEESWQYIEDDWYDLVSKIERSCRERVKTLDSDDISLLIDFIFAQQFRTLQKLKEFGELIESLLQMIGLDRDLGDKFEEVSQDFSRSYFLNTVEGIQINDKNFAFRRYYDELSKLQVVFFSTYGNKAFFTNDNPVFKVIDDNFYKGKLNGLYMPITPGILCGLFKGDSNKYMLDTMPDNHVKRFNKLIVKNTHKYLVSCRELSGLSQ